MAFLPAAITWGKTLNLNQFSLMNIAMYQEKCPKKSDTKAYQYFLEQYVHDIWVSGKHGEQVYIKAKCNASQNKQRFYAKTLGMPNQL